MKGHLVILSACAFLVGCSADYKASTKEFKDTVDASSKSVGVYFLELNSFERQVYLEGILADKDLSLALTDDRGKKTALGGEVFSTESVKARMDSIRLIGKYAELLVNLADSDAPTKFASAADALGKNLSGLNESFSKLSGTADSTAGKYITPVAALVGTIGKLVIDGQRNQAIEEGVRTGAPAVRTILALLKDDCVDAIEPLRKTGLKQILSDKVLSYNESRGTLSYDQRQARLDQIKALAERYDAFSQADPSGLIDAIAEAHEALIKHVLDPRDDAKRLDVAGKAVILRARSEAESEAIKAIVDAEKKGL